MSSISETGSTSTPPRAYNPARTLLHDRNTGLLLFLLGHILLGFIVLSVPQLVNLHVAITLVIALALAALRAPLSQVAAAAAYIVGAEVLWRASNASIFWEAGKYAIVLVMLIALFRTRSTRIPVAPFLYFLFLLPAIFVTLGTMSASEARGEISFNLSGPLALFVSAWFFSCITLNRNELQIFLISCLAPFTALTSLVFFNLLRLSQINWIAASNFSTSGGFGPNQVSSVLGLGVLMIWILLIIMPRRSLLNMILQLLALWMLIQSILTFSRGGIVTSLAAIGFLVLHLFAGRKRRKIVIVTGLFLLLSLELTLPLLNSFTLGTLEQRYVDPSLSGRDVLVQQDLQHFLENPITGVGPGGVANVRNVAAHTEYSRMLAEHGILGAISLVLLLSMPVKNYFNGTTLISRGIRCSFMIWSLVTFAHSAMRLAATPFTFGFGFVTIDLSDANEDAKDAALFKQP